MSNEEEKRCPLCAEEMDWTDQQLKPCKCGYQVCVWCWHHIMEMAEKYETEGKCPACRTPYDKERVVGTEAKFERVVINNSNRKHKPPKAKPKISEGRKDLTNVRVIQRKIAYVIGLPLSLADEDLLQRKEYFGQYGKVSKVSLSRTAGGAVQQFVNDTCSVYITYLKEEEAVRCIQSVHGFVLEGSFLRASFGTAKYCHAWLRNTPCNNPACLYLHSVGAEEDSFGKDEVAAVHTRSRVQQIVGDTHNLQRRSGNVLPTPVDEQHFTNSCASNDNPTVPSGPKDFALATVNSSGHLTNLPSFNDKDGSVRAFNKMTTFVDIVGRSCSSGSEKDGNASEDRRILNLCSELSSLSVDGDSHIEAGPSDSLLCKVSSSNHLVNEFPVNKEFNEPFRESSNLLALRRADITPIDASVTKEQSYATLDSGRLELHGPCNSVREDLLSFDDQRLRDFDSLSQTASLLPSSAPAMIPEDSSDQAWRHRESRSLNDYNLDRNTVNNYVDEVSVQFTHVNSISNEGYNERKFQSSAKSDRIYRCSNLFSNEEIVEHLRRLDGDDMTNDDENPALDAVKSSIISNLMSLDFDACDESSTLPHNYTGLFDETDGQHGSSWNFHNSDQSGFPFAKQEGSASQLTDLRSSFSYSGQESKKCSVLQDSGEIKEHYLCKPPYHVSRAQCLTPPGFPLPSREPPPGFPACDRTDQVVRAMCGNHLVKSSLPNNHYRTPSTGNSSNTSDVDLIDPAILVASRGKSTNGLSNSCLDMGSGYASSRPSSFEDEARLWLLMQQSTAAHQGPKFPQTYMQQTPPAHQEPKYSGRIGDGFSSWDDIYGISSRLADQHRAYNPSSFTEFSQPNFANGHFSNGYHQPSFDEVQHRNEVGVAESQINERLGFNKFLPGYGDYMLQMPSSGDVYTRVFGM